MRLHRAIDELCSLCEEVGRLSQDINLMYKANNLNKELYSREEILNKESEFHCKIHECHNLRVEIENACPCEVNTRKDK